jgi:hypothetical protein
LLNQRLEFEIKLNFWQVLKNTSITRAVKVLSRSLLFRTDSEDITGNIMRFKLNQRLNQLQLQENAQCQ